ncbi:MAG: STAS domain-containing protein [Actinomycetota bacterium]|nr:STAS domain-containing protein [Actinomycetota bacterium]
MTVEPTTEAGALVLVPDIELDLLTCPEWHCELIGALKREDCKVLIVDFSQVEFFGAIGLEVLVDIRDRAARCGVDLRLIVCSRPVWRPLKVTGLAGDFSIYGSRADALTGYQA